MGHLHFSKGAIDWSASLRQVNWSQATASTRSIDARCSTLLEQAEEHCRQLLLSRRKEHEIISKQEEQFAYSAFACLIRIATQRAILARLNGSHHTAARELTLASHFCRSILDSLSSNSFPQTEINLALTLYSGSSITPPPTLPVFSNEAHSNARRSALSQAELYLAVGEVAEEHGRAATNHEYEHACYLQADVFLEAAIDCLHTANQQHDCDPGYLLHIYQRSIALLEERAVHYEWGKEITSDVFLALLKAELSALPNLLLPSENA